MPPIAKQSDVIALTPGTTTANPPSTSTLSETPVGRPQPVALEVPVTVNGARTVDGTDKREPFSETTKTVLVLSNGAVIRLASTVAPGQLLFLTNEKTKKEVVCQVVKSKNYRNVSGYVELEFTEPVLGFWGMRFPSDRIAPAPVTPPPVAAMSPLKTVPPSPKIATLVATSIPETLKAPLVPPPVTPPVAEVRPAEPKLVEVAVKPPEIPVPIAPLAAKPEIPVIRVPVAPAVATPPPLPSLNVAPVNQVPVPGSSEALKLETARLQEQLSSLLFSGSPAEKAPHPQPFNLPSEKKEMTDAAAKILEFAQSETAALKPPLVKTPPSAPSLGEENVKIPAWLEPLARNTIAPASTQELIEREKARRAAEKTEKPEKPETTEPLIPSLTVAEVVDVPEVRIPSFGDELLFDEKKSSEKISHGSNKGVWIGAIAAGLILAAGGGAWYLRQQGGFLKNSVTSAATPATTVAASVLQPKPQPVAPVQSALVNNLGVIPPAAATSTGINAQISKPRDAAPSPVAANTAVAPKSTPTLPVLQQTHVAQEQPKVAPQQDEPQLAQKKPGLGQVHLASPKINRPVASHDGVAAEPGLSLNGDLPATAGDSMGGDLVAGSARQPAAPAEPLPVGGDVTPAKLLSSVAPVYSSIARFQHVTGDVKVDALISENGRVTSTKVISGPTLLHQPAIDAVRQWKYQPATLDGKPVPMHLTVTLQFRLH